MQNKNVKKWISSLVLIAFASTLAPSAGIAGNLDPLDDTAAELESAVANLEDTQAMYNTSVDELDSARTDHSSSKQKNIEQAARIRQEIARLNKELKANHNQAKNLSEKARQFNSQTSKIEADEKRTQKSADAAANQLDKARTAYNNSKDRKELSAQALKDLKAKWARTQQELKAKSRELTAAKNAEQKSAATLKNAQANFKKYQIQSVKEMERLHKQTQIALAKTASNERKTETLRARKQQLEEAVQQKRQRLSNARNSQGLSRVSSN